MKVALFEPQIPPNTGNIVRLCAAVQIELILIGKLGFSLSDKNLKRAGLDYWELAHVRSLPSLEELYRQNATARFWYLSTKGKQAYFKTDFANNDILVFGSETAGLPDTVLNINFTQVLTIPMVSGIRSLNLANSVSIVVYEAVRQLGLPLG